MRTYIIRIMAIIVLLGSIGTDNAKAQARIDTIFANMPDSLLPYLTRNNRLDCIDFIQNNMKAEVENLFGTKSELVVLTDDYLQLRLNSITTLEMKLLKSGGRDSVVCLSKTILSPEPFSELTFFDTRWNAMSVDFKLDKIIDLIGRSDYIMHEARLSKDDETVTINMRRIFSKDRELTGDTVKTLKYRWNGTTLEQEL